MKKSSEQTVISADKYYTITAANGKVVEVADFNPENGAAIQLWDYAGEDWQQWSFVRAGDGVYRICNKFTGKMLDLIAGGVVDGKSRALLEAQGLRIPAILDENDAYEGLKACDGLLITGPFSILLGFEGGMMALNDRLKLRSMVAAERGDIVYVASEEAAIRIIAPELDKIWSPAGGEPVIVTLNGGEPNAN